MKLLLFLPRPFPVPSVRCHINLFCTYNLQTSFHRVSLSSWWRSMHPTQSCCSRLRASVHVQRHPGVLFSVTLVCFSGTSHRIYFPTRKPRIHFAFVTHILMVGPILFRDRYFRIYQTSRNVYQGPTCNNKERMIPVSRQQPHQTIALTAMSAFGKLG